MRFSAGPAPQGSPCYVRHIMIRDKRLILTAVFELTKGCMNKVLDPMKLQDPRLESPSLGRPGTPTDVAISKYQACIADSWRTYGTWIRAAITCSNLPSSLHMGLAMK